MLKNIITYFFLILLFSSCADISILSGGDKDIISPQINKVIPLFGTTNFNSKEISFTFNEYIKLNNPSQNITLSPNSSKLNAKAYGNKVTIEINDTLEQNTTYQLRFNHAIQDITEANDSLINYVFSTGATLDSLSHTVKVIDAFTNNPVKNVMVGFFRDNDSINPFYLRMTDKNGSAFFDYLKEGIYKVKAWEDGNSFNAYYDKKFGVLEMPLTIKSEISDSSKILFAKLEKTKTDVSFHQLSDFLISINGIKHKDFKSVKLTKDSLRELNSHWYSNDSIIIEAKYKAYDKIAISYLSNNKIIDTVFTIEKLINDDNLSITPINNKKEFKYNEPLLFVLNDFISSTDLALEMGVDTSKNWPFKTENVSVLNLNINDTLDNEIKNKSISPVRRLIALDRKINGQIASDSLTFIGLKLNQFKLEVDDLKLIKVIFNPNSIKAKNLPNNDTITHNFKIYYKEDLGSIALNVKNLDSSDLVCLMKNQKDIEKKKVFNDTLLLFKDLYPGDYTFKIIKDKDGNNNWSQWLLKPYQEPEKILWFNTPIKVRANWEVEMKLELNNEK